MPRNFTLPAIMFLAIVFTSCQKTLKTDKLVAGEPSTAMTYRIFYPPKEVVVSSTGGQAYDSLDVDGDGQYDLIFSVYSSRWTGPGSAVNAKNCTEILADYSLEEFYLAIRPNNPTIPYDTIVYNLNSSFSDRQPSDVLVSTKDYFYPSQFEAGQIIPVNDPTNHWKDRADFSNITEGPSYVDSTYYYFKFGTWGGVDNRYFAFRKNCGSTTRYGWVKVSVSKFAYIKVIGYALDK